MQVRQFLKYFMALLAMIHILKYSYTSDTFLLFHLIKKGC